MKQKISVISSLGLTILLLAGLLIPAKPASAGIAVWTAETIPNILDNVLGPTGIDVRSFSKTTSGDTIYAAPGDSIADKFIYRSSDQGATWTEIDIAIKAEFVAVAPDDRNIIAIANSTTAEVYYTNDGGTTWYDLDIPQENGHAPADVITALAISPTRDNIHYIAVTGQEAGNIANIWYIDIGAAVPTWKEGRSLAGFSEGSTAAALSFSSSFVSDRAMIIVTANSSVGVHLQIFDIDAKKWNAAASYYDYPYTIVSNNGTTGLSSASISLAPDFLASEDDNKVFISLTVEGNDSAQATSGIYRFMGIVKKQLSSNIKIHSVAFNGSYLVAGSYDSTTVYRCTSPLASSPTVLVSATTKRPSGTNKVLVSWLSSSIIAGTCGNESSFTVSTDNGQTFNDVSLIDTVIENARDVAVTTDGATVYLVTDDNTDLSLWRKKTVWRRVFCLKNTIDYIVRIERTSGKEIYLAKKGTDIIYYNGTSGESQWITRDCRVNVQDMAVESSAVVYVLNASGGVTKTKNRGASWGNTVSTKFNSGATIVSAGSGKLLAGSQDGYVAYSNDGNITWTRINEVIEPGAGNVHVVADQYYSSNHIIYAASDTTGQNIKKWKIGTSNEWADVFRGTLTGGIYGLAINNNILYALEFNAITGQSTLWIHISPNNATATSTSWSSSTTTAETDIDDSTVNMNATPRALKLSKGKAWAVKTNLTNKLYSFTDIDISLTLVTPASGFICPVNSLKGIPLDICFTWERPFTTTEEYELDIALDSYFYRLVATITVANDYEIASVIIGPGQSGNNMVDFMPGTTYYWRIRTSQPVYSRYSATKYFFTQPINAILPEILAPRNGQANVSLSPAFSWAPVSGATEYQFILSDNYTMVSPIVDITVGNTGFSMTDELEHGGTYFWQVRAIKPIETEWSQLSNFTVAERQAKPGPVVTVEKLAPPTVELPEQPPEIIINQAPPLKPPPPIVPDYLRTAIYLMSALLLVVIILIFLRYLTRLLPARETITEPLRGPSKRVIKIANDLGKVWDDVATRTRGVLPLPARETTTGKAPEIDTISFAVRSFLYMTTTPEGEGGKMPLSAEEESTLGKKLASGVKALAAESTLYLAYPGDAAQFLEIWAHYGSREETNRYLKKSFRGRPENALALLKCYLPAPEGKEAGAAETPEFTRAEYDTLAKIVDMDNVYEPVAKLLKFRFEKEGDKGLADPVDRSLAYQFVRIHYDIKK